ncbi:hypothetical protein U0070_025367, partial [Myodes glareolus]
YIVECHGVTLLPQFLGMYRLNVDGVEIYVIVTRNVFSHRLSVYRKYDLKGSTVAREASDKEKVSTITPPSCPGSTGQGLCSFFSSPTPVVLPLPLLLRAAPVQPGDACLHHLPR